MVFNLERFLIDPPRSAFRLYLNFCIILFILFILLLFNVVVLIIVINIGPDDVNDCLVMFLGEDLIHCYSALLSTKLSQLICYLWCYIPLVGTSQVCLFERPMHLLIWLSVEVGCNALSLNIIRPMLMAVDFVKVPFFCPPTVLMVAL